MMTENLEVNTVIWKEKETLGEQGLKHKAQEVKDWEKRFGLDLVLKYERSCLMLLTYGQLEVKVMSTLDSVVLV